MTAQEIIEAAFTELGIYTPGTTPPASEITWGLAKLNRLLNTLSASGVNLHYRVEENFNVSDGTASYTIGDGATFDTERPTVIEQAFIRDGDTDYLVKVRPIAEYWGLSDKTTESRPTKLFYDTTYTDGTDGTIYLHYVPNQTYELHFVSQKPLTTYTDEDTDVVLPGQYEDFLVLKLAFAFAPRFGKSVSRELDLAIQKADGAVRGLNIARTMKPASIRVSSSSGGGEAYNVESG